MRDPAKIADLPTPLSSFGAAVVGDAAYLYGGHAGQAHHYSRATTRGHFLRLASDRWEELPGGPTLQGLSLVAHDGKLIRVGGMVPHNEPGEKSDLHSQTGCAAFDVSTGRWTDLTPLPSPRSSHDAAVLGDHLYVFGGWRLSGSDGKPAFHDHGLRLDLSRADADWERVPQPFRRRALTMAAHQGRLHVIGGMTPENRVERRVDVFDPAANEWLAGPPLPGDDAHGFTPASCVWNGALFVAPSDGTLLRLDGDAWRVVGRCQEHRFSARLVAVGGRVLLIGGASRSGLLASVEAVTPG